MDGEFYVEGDVARWYNGSIKSEFVRVIMIQDQMKWVGLMNNIKVSAEEIILKNMVYV